MRRLPRQILYFVVLTLVGPLVGLWAALVLVPGLGLFLVPWGFVLAIGTGGPPSALTALFLLVARRRMHPLVLLAATVLVGAGATAAWMTALSGGPSLNQAGLWLIAIAAFSALVCAAPFVLLSGRSRAAA